MRLHAEYNKNNTAVFFIKQSYHLWEEILIKSPIELYGGCSSVGLLFLNIDIFISETPGANCFTLRMHFKMHIGMHMGIPYAF